MLSLLATLSTVVLWLLGYHVSDVSEECLATLSVNLTTNDVKHLSLPAGENLQEYGADLLTVILWEFLSPAEQRVSILSCRNINFAFAASVYGCGAFTIQYRRVGFVHPLLIPLVNPLTSSPRTES